MVNLDDLPLEILSEVGCSLPVYAIFSFRMICKLFLKLDFRKMIPLHNGLLKDRTKFMRIFFEKEDLLGIYLNFEPLSRHLYAVIFATCLGRLIEGRCQDVMFHENLIVSFRVCDSDVKFRCDVRKVLLHEQVIELQKSNLENALKRIEYLKKNRSEYGQSIDLQLPILEKMAKDLDKDLKNSMQQRFTQYV